MSSSPITSPASSFSVSPRQRSSSSTFMRGAVCGGLGAMVASMCTHPIELVKVRLQLAGELSRGPSAGLISTIKQMVAREGVKGLYSGLSASMMRQSIFAPVRFGCYQMFQQNRPLLLLDWNSSAPTSLSSVSPPMWEKFIYSILSGCIGGLCSSPADLVMIRMQADGRLDGTSQRKYRGVFGGLMSVTQESGITGLWRGTAPNVYRAMITTSSQFIAYDYFKSFTQRHLHLDGIGLHFTASLLSSVVVACCASPMDVVRTRMMNSNRPKPKLPTLTPAHIEPTNAATLTQANAPIKPTHTLASPSAPSSVVYARAYRNTLDCIRETIRVEGVRGLYKGFIPYYCRVAPQVTLMFVFFEQFQSVYSNIIGDD